MPIAADAFLMVRTVHAPRALVWQAWTDPKLFVQWWGPRALTNCECALDVRVGGSHSVTMQMPDGTRNPIRGEYLEVLPMQRLVMTMDCTDHPAAWHDMIRPGRAPGDNNAPGIMVQTVQFEDDGDRTRLTIHTRFDSVQIRNAMVQLGMNQGWSESVEKLNEQLAALTGIVDRHIVISRAIKAPRERVWAAMTDPQQVVKWWGPNGFSTTIVEMDVRVGGVWKHTMHGPDGTDYPNKSIFKEVLPPVRIVYAHGGGKVGGKGVNFVSTWTFEELGEGTLLTIRMVFPTPADRDHVVAEYGAIEGGRQTLGRLDAYLAQGHGYNHTVIGE
jgi:uncharacterized protein YndB with AHSA1/START domain